MGAARPTLAKDLRVAQAAGLTVTGIERLPDGGWRLLTSGGAMTADDELSRARDRRRARHADRAA